MVTTEEIPKVKSKRGGARPGAGRPSSVDEGILAELARKSTQWAIDNWDTISEDNRLKLTVAFGARYIPQKVQSTGTLDVTFTEFKSDLSDRMKLLGIN